MKKLSIFVGVLILLAIIFLFRDNMAYKHRYAIYDQIESVEKEFIRLEGLRSQMEMMKDHVASLKRDNTNDYKNDDRIAKTENIVKEYYSRRQSKKNKYLSLVNSYNDIYPSIIFNDKKLPEKVAIGDFADKELHFIGSVNSDCTVKRSKSTDEKLIPLSNISPEAAAKVIPDGCKSKLPFSIYLDRKHYYFFDVYDNISLENKPSIKNHSYVIDSKTGSLVSIPLNKR